MKQQMLKDFCQTQDSSDDQCCQNLPADPEAEETALLTDEAVCEDDSVDSATDPVPVVLPALLSAGVEVAVAEVSAVATPVGVLPLV